MPRRPRLGYIDECLLQFAKDLSMPLCRKFKLKKPKIRLFDEDSPDRCSSRGMCYEDGLIELDFRTKNLRSFARLNTIIDTVVHELAHLRYLHHGAKFWALHKRMMTWTKNNLINPK